MLFRHFLVAVGTYLLTINVVLALPGVGPSSGKGVVHADIDLSPYEYSPIDSDERKSGLPCKATRQQLLKYLQLSHELELAKYLLQLAEQNPPQKALDDVLNAEKRLTTEVTKMKEQCPDIDEQLERATDLKKNPAWTKYLIKVISTPKIPGWAEGMDKWSKSQGTD